MTPWSGVPTLSPSSARPAPSCDLSWKRARHPSSRPKGLTETSPLGSETIGARQTWFGHAAASAHGSGAPRLGCFSGFLGSISAPTPAAHLPGSGVRPQATSHAPSPAPALSHAAAARLVPCAPRLRRGPPGTQNAKDGGGRCPGDRGAGRRRVEGCSVRDAGGRRPARPVGGAGLASARA